MTFKKSMISIAAAGVIAATLTGCGSSGSSTTTTTTTTTPTTTTTAPTSFEAVDGKIMNAVATAYYVDDNNVTQSITLDANKSYTDVVTSVASKGSYAYTLPEANASLADSIRYVEINGTAATVVSGKSYPATFIDVDGSGDYNASVDQVFTGQLIAPKGGEYASPISTLVYNVVGASAMTAADFNATLLDNALNTIAARLNLTADDIKTVDPMAEGKSEFKYINAMLGGQAATAATLANIATALEAADTNSTDFAGVVSYLATNGGTAATLFTAIDAQLDAGTLKVADLATINVDKTRANGGTPVLETASATTIGDINSTKVDTVDVASLINTGAKVATGSVVMTFAAGSATDANASGTVDLYLSLSNPEARREVTDNGSKLVIKVSNIDIERTSGTTTLDVNTSKAKTSYEWYIDDATSKTNYLSATDVNDTHIDLDAVITSNTINLGTLITNVEGNISSTDNNASFTFAGKIADLTAIIVDSDGLLQQVDSSGNAKLWSTATVTGTGNALTAEGKSILNVTANMRSGVTTGANSAPSITSFQPQTANSGVSIVSSAGAISATETAALSGATIVINEGTGDVTDTYRVVLNDEATENNTTGVLSSLPSWVTVTSATLVGAANDGNLDFNLTIDGNATVSGHGSDMAYVKLTDEFGKVNSTDTNVTFMFNHAPTAVAGTVDVNISAATANDANRSTTITLSDTDGIADLNSSASGGLEAISITALYGYNGDANTSGYDVNWSATSDNNITSIAGYIAESGTLAFDVNTTAHGATSNITDGNVTVTYTVTDIYGAVSTEKNATIRIAD